MQSVKVLETTMRARWKALHDDTVRRAIAPEEADIKTGRTQDSRFRMGLYVFTGKRDS